MALVKWNPWTEIDTLKHDIDQLFRTHFSG
jgi:hypothetical protein